MLKTTINQTNSCKISNPHQLMYPFMGVKRKQGFCYSGTIRLHLA